MAEERRNRQFWLETTLIFAAWTVSGLLQANQFYIQSQLRGRPVSWADALRPGLLESLLWALATLGIFWLARRFPLERGRMLPNVTVHLIAALIHGLARAALMVELGQHVEWVGTRTFTRQFWGTSGQNFLFYTLLLGIAHAVVYHARFRERERAAERLAAGLTEARLQVLKAQLQPHFLFNTLNAISALIPVEAKPARRMVARLGDLLRITLEHEATQEVTLREELSFLQPYVEIEQARLEDRLTVRMDIPPATLDARVPHLLLQPLVENAIRHGIAPRIEPGTVEISARKSEDGSVLHLEVRDDGPGLELANHAKVRKGVGLTNIQLRLEQLYPDQHQFSVQNRPEGGVVVKISVPFRRAERTTMPPEPPSQ